MYSVTTFKQSLTSFVQSYEKHYLYFQQQDLQIYSNIIYILYLVTAFVQSYQIQHLYIQKQHMWTQWQHSVYSVTSFVHLATIFIYSVTTHRKWYFQEEDKKMRSYAVVPPMMLDARQRKLRYTNNNGRVEDPMAEDEERKFINVWTPQEKNIFKEKYLQHPKNFSYIAQFLERKVILSTMYFEGGGGLCCLFFLIW